MNYQTVLNWLVRSSKNPENLAATVKGLLLSASSSVLFLAPLLGLHLDIGQYTELANAAYGITQQVLLLVGCVVSIFGFGRKIYLTLAPAR